jgi:protein SCO1/2
MVLSIAALAGLCGCDRNTAPPPDAAAENGNGSYPADNRADCLPAVELVDQYGSARSLASLKGKPVLIDFIYANCATACPLLTAKFAAIAKLIRPELGARMTMVSITVDPEHDTPETLLTYAKTHDASYRGWFFLDGKPELIDRVLQIYRLRRERAADGSIAHVTTAFLLGGDGRQLRQYDALAVAPATVAGDIDRALARG